MSAISNSEYEFIRKLVYEQSRINLGSDKKELVAARLNKRLRETGIPTIGEYCAYLEKEEEELANLLDVISTNHTFFFREIQHFQFLMTVALPEIVQRMAASKETVLRVWSAASSTGEEPFSIAIHLEEFFKGKPNAWKMEATDISTRVLAHAEQGVYPLDRLREIPQELFRKYFQRGVGAKDGYFRIKEPLRNAVRFSRMNLLQPHYPFHEPFHLVFCRNVMIYFDRATQEELVNKISSHMIPGAYLMIGHSESLTGVKHPFRAVKPAIYQKPEKNL